MRLALLSFLLLVAACDTTRDPLAVFDRRYSTILVELNAARRDTTRNVHNRDARLRKIAAEKKLLEFFQSPALATAIQQAREAPEGSPLQVKGEAWWRHAVYIRSWKEDEKEQESELLARIDAINGTEATWGHPDGAVEISLDDRWTGVSQAADDLPESLRSDLAQEYVNHRMSLVGDELRRLVKLRNQVARREGFETYWHLALYHRGLDPETVDTLIEDLHPVIQPVTHEYAQAISSAAEESGLENNFANNPLLRRMAGLESGRDEAEPYFDTDLAEDRIRTSLSNMGIGVGKVQIYSGPSRYTLSGAYSFPIRLPDLSAVVVSLDKRYEIWFYEALIHELGYTWWWQSLSPDLLASPVLWEPPPAYMEGFAQTFERVLYAPRWLANYLPQLPAEKARNLVRWRARQTAIWLTDAIVESAVERRTYQDPNNWAAVARYCSDIESLYEVYAGPTPVTHEGLPYCDALLSPLVWHYPAYVQNYIFSYVTETRLYEAMQSSLGTIVDNPQVGPWLQENIVAEGGATPFEERMIRVAGDGSRTEALRRYIESGHVNPGVAGGDEPEEGEDGEAGKTEAEEPGESEEAAP